MKNKSLVKDYITRGGIRLKALDSLYDQGGYADVVREAQEIVELVGKALVRFLGAEPARVHDVSAQLSDLKDRIETKHRKGLDELIAISRQLRRDRELAFYGSEDLTPGEFYSRSDADEARKGAETVLKYVRAVTAI